VFGSKKNRRREFFFWKIIIFPLFGVNKKSWKKVRSKNLRKVRKIQSKIFASKKFEENNEKSEESYPSSILP